MNYKRQTKIDARVLLLGITCLMLLATFFLQGCAGAPYVLPNGSENVSGISSSDSSLVSPSLLQPTQSFISQPLAWENTTAPHPERKPWSQKLGEIIKADLALYSSAKDVTRVCPKYKSLTDLQKIHTMQEMWVAIYYYESGYNPASFSVDVGKPKDNRTWSVGLGQMSEIDSAAKFYGATFETLKGPLMGIKVSTRQMNRQLTRSGLLILPNEAENRYWAVFLDGNKYSQIANILYRVKKYAPECAA